jgi:hypothetical protein
VSRSAVLLGAFLTIAAEMRCPLNLLEIGASAGLNLAFDQYRYDLGVGRWGDEASPVAIQCEWSGEAPRLDASLDVVARAACDRNPLDPASTNDRDRLLAYIWADQGQRLARMSAALDLARRRTWSVDRADAADWLESRRSALPQDAVTVIFHTIVWQYLAEATRDRIKGILNAAAERARPASPLAWLRMEAEGDSAGLRLTTWPGGEEKLLGHADFHGRWVRWL